jgi:hypothetical protein
MRKTSDPALRDMKKKAVIEDPIPPDSDTVALFVFEKAPAPTQIAEMTD